MKITCWLAFAQTPDGWIYPGLLGQSEITLLVNSGTCEQLGHNQIVNLVSALLHSTGTSLQYIQ